MQYLWCNNEGENITFERTCKQEGLEIDFEYTAPGMRQQNGWIKWKFTTPFNWVCTMLNGGKFNAHHQNGLWAKTANTAMHLDNNLITPHINLSPFQQFFEKGKRSILSSMQKFCDMCIPTYRDNTHWAKLASQGTPGIWVGYAEGHLTGTYGVFNPKIKKVILTGDVTFLQKPVVSLPRLKNLSWWLRVMRGWMMMRNLEQFL